MGRVVEALNAVRMADADALGDWWQDGKLLGGGDAVPVATVPATTAVVERLGDAYTARPVGSAQDAREAVRSGEAEAGRAAVFVELSAAVEL